jgi:pimeloyl-ACP methyl ester carboxylesterase
MSSFSRNAGVAILCFLLIPVTGVAQDKFFDSNGVRIRYVEQGNGDAIVLIHGFGNSLDSWISSGVLPNLARHYRVIAFDARGHGKSGKPPDVNAYGREIGLDVIRLQNHLGIQRAHIIGHSMGARLAAQLLTTHSERFITATLNGHAGLFRWTREDAERAEQEASETERECVSRSQIYRLAPTNAPKPDEEEIKRLSAACMADPNKDRFVLAGFRRSLKDWVITPTQVSAVRVPTLAVVGSLDGALRDFEDLKKLRPDVTLVVIDGATHTGTRGADRQPEFIEAVREFITSNRPTSSR